MIGSAVSRAMIFASPIADPPPAAIRPSALAARVAASPASAIARGTWITASACRPAERPARRSATRAPSRAPLPGVAITSAWATPSRAASSATHSMLPAPNTTRCDGASWMKWIVIASEAKQSRPHGDDAEIASARDARLAMTRGSIPLAPDAERLLRGPVGDRKQHRLLRGVVRIALPRRHHEHVLRAPFERLAVDGRRSLPFDADEDRAVGRAVRLALEAFRQERKVRPHGRQHRSAGDR